jgi:hypothetical protein
MYTYTFVVRICDIIYFFSFSVMHSCCAFNLVCIIILHAYILSQDSFFSLLLCDFLFLCTIFVHEALAHVHIRASTSPKIVSLHMDTKHSSLSSDFFTSLQPLHSLPWPHFIAHTHSSSSFFSLSFSLPSPLFHSSVSLSHTLILQPGKNGLFPLCHTALLLPTLLDLFRNLQSIDTTGLPHSYAITPDLEPVTSLCSWGRSGS